MIRKSKSAQFEITIFQKVLLATRRTCISCVAVNQLTPHLFGGLLCSDHNGATARI